MCVALAVVQTAYIFIPPNALRLFNLGLRPLVYGVLAAALLVFMDFDFRPVRKAYRANMAAFLSIMMFGIVFLIVAFLLGAGRNAMAPGPAIAFRNLWEHGSVVILGELIRYKLIKGGEPRNRAAIIIALTIMLAYGQMNAIRMFAGGNVAVPDIIFETAFRLLVISAVVSYFAVEGSFLSVVMVSLVYTMVPYLVPVLPDVSQLVWSLIISGMAFVTAIIYRFAMNDKRRDQRMRTKRMDRVARKPILANVVTVAVVAVIIAFFAGAFPFYPVVILTGSMTGTMDRGSLVFVERVPPGRAVDAVGEGYVVHFLSRGRVEYVHRVVDFGWDSDGQRHYITQGDAVMRPDPIPVPQADILGIARAQIPFLGYPYILVQNAIRAFG